MLRRALRRPRHQADRHRLLVLGILGLPCRAGVLVHLGDRLDRRGSADQRVARRDGRAPGRSTRPTSSCSPARSTPRWCTASASRRQARCAACWRCRPTRTRSRRCGRTRCRSAGLQARFGLDSGKWTDEQMAQVALDSLGRAERTDSVEPADERSTSCWPGRSSPTRCAATTSRRSPTAPRRSCSPPATAPASCANDPAWITGIEHRIETPVLGARDLTTSPSTAASAKAAHRRRCRLDRRRRALRPVHPPAADPHRGDRAEADRRRSTRPAARWRPTRCSPPVWSGSASRPGTSSTGRRSGCWRTPPAGLRCNRIWSRPGGRQLMAKNLAAVLGTGQTKYVAKRKDVSMNGLVREAIDRALADSGSTFDDIDAVVVGKAPDFFEGVMMPELFMADAIGATGKPLIRVHTAGSVGGSTAIVAASLVQSGKYRRVLTDGLGEAVRVQCDVGAVDSGAVHQARRRRRGRLLRAARARLHPPLGRAEAHRRDGRGQGPAQRRQEPARPPAPARHHAREGDGVPDAVGSDPLRRDLPVLRRRLRDGDRRRGDRRRSASPTAIRWPGSTPPRCAPNRWPTPGATRSTRRPAATPRPRCGRRPASPARSTRSTSPRSTCRSPGSSRCGWRTSASRPRARAGS